MYDMFLIKYGKLLVFLLLNLQFYYRKFISLFKLLIKFIIYTVFISQRIIKFPLTYFNVACMCLFSSFLKKKRLLIIDVVQDIYFISNQIKFSWIMHQKNCIIKMVFNYCRKILRLKRCKNLT